MKQLTSNTLGAYGVGDQHSFAYSVGRKIRLVEINVEPKGDRWEATTVAEVPVTRGANYLEGCDFILIGDVRHADTLNGAGMMHGGCVCYIADKYVQNARVTMGLLIV